MNITLLYDNSLDCWNTIKLSALYFDKTDVHTQMALRMDVLTQDCILEDFKINKDGTFHTPFILGQNGHVENYRIHQLNFSDKRITSQFDTLSKEGILKFKCSHQSHREIDIEIRNKIRDYIFENLDMIFDGITITKKEGQKSIFDLTKMRISDTQTNENMYVLDRAFKEITSYYKKKYGNNAKAFLYNVVDLYFLIICDFYNKLCTGITTISSNNFVSHIIKLIYQDTNAERKTNDLGTLSTINAIPIFLPSFYDMNCEDILDLRYFAKDELEEMRFYINNLSFEYSTDDKKLTNVNIFLENKIRPSIKNLESKIYGLKVGTIQKALQNLKNPLSYTPLLTSFFTDIPSHIALALSMGLITAEVGLEYQKQKKELETDPLFFSVKLKNIVKNKVGL